MQGRNAPFLPPLTAGSRELILFGLLLIIAQDKMKSKDAKGTSTNQALEVMLIVITLIVMISFFLMIVVF